jgi:hypothetical protein
MSKDQIMALQARVGAVADGFWGPKSIAACQRHLKKLMPNPHPWPKSDEASLMAFYGKAGDERQLVALEVDGLRRELDEARELLRAAEGDLYSSPELRDRIDAFLAAANELTDDEKRAWQETREGMNR